MKSKSNGQMKSFKELTEENQMARTRYVMDKVAADAISTLSEFDHIHALIMEHGNEIPQPAPKAKGSRKIPRNRQPQHISFETDKDLQKTLAEVGKLWRVSRSAIIRYALWVMLYKYGFISSVDEVLKAIDRKALVRDPTAPRPFVSREEASDKWKRTRTGIGHYPGDNAKRPPGVHPTSPG